MGKEQILTWLNEIADEEPSNFQEYFYDDVRNFVIEEKLDTKKVQSIFQCHNKNEVKKWVESVCSYIVMHSDTDLIIEDYFH